MCIRDSYNADNAPRGSRRVTSDVYALATAVLFQSPVQHFALAPNNLTDAPSWAIDFMKEVPTTWDEVRFIDGYPGKYVILARRHGCLLYTSLGEVKIETEKPVTLQVTANGDDYRFNYSIDGKGFINLGGTVSGDILSTNVAGGFTAVSYTHLDVYKRQVSFLKRSLTGMAVLVRDAS